MNVVFVRLPYLSRYSYTNVREDAIITYALGHLKTYVGVECRVKDFHLDRGLKFDDLVNQGADAFVLAVRETGANVHYVIRLCASLLSNTSAQIVLYGQTGRLKHLGPLSDRVRIVPHDENRLAGALGLEGNGPSFESENLPVAPYIEQVRLTDHQWWRRRGSLESTRGCHFPCKFCFINNGQNYPERWQLRSPSACVADIQRYRRMGISDFVFHDSEFIGARSSDYPRHVDLLDSIRKETPGISFKAYARADTFLAFHEFDLFQQAGLTGLFIGVESLCQDDLDHFKKKLLIEDLLACIEELRDRHVFLTLSFMLFNGNTSVETLEQNIRQLKRLSRKNTRYLGMPGFLFSYETNWKSGGRFQLSNKSYVRWMLHKRTQPNNLSTFNSALEPLIELCRLVDYDLAMKTCSVNLARDTASSEDLASIDRWCDDLWPFAIDVLDETLSWYIEHRPTMQDAARRVPAMYSKLEALYSQLPDGLRGLETWRGHGENAALGLDLPLEDHGWDSIIPGRIH
jgi:hypothetical protein